MILIDQRVLRKENSKEERQRPKLDTNYIATKVSGYWKNGNGADFWKQFLWHIAVPAKKAMEIFKIEKTLRTASVGTVLNKSVERNWQVLSCFTRSPMV